MDSYIEEIKFDRKSAKEEKKSISHMNLKCDGVNVTRDIFYLNFT